MVVPRHIWQSLMVPWQDTYFCLIGGCTSDHVRALPLMEKKEDSWQFPS